MEQNDKSFNYTYSAKQRDEIERIKSKYTVREESTLEKVRRLDDSVTKKASIASIIIGTVGALVMGLGMSLAMTELGDFLGAAAMPAGIAIGLCGIAAVAVAYPIYRAVLKKERRHVAPEILRLINDSQDQ